MNNHKQAALIVGNVEYREGDGANIVIRPGPCEVQQTALDAVISWTEGQTHGSAVMPLTDFKACIERGAIRMLDSPATARE